MRLLAAIALSPLLSGCLASLPVDPVPPMSPLRLRWWWQLLVPLGAATPYGRTLIQLSIGGTLRAVAFG